MPCDTSQIMKHTDRHHICHIPFGRRMCSYFPGPCDASPISHNGQCCQIWCQHAVHGPWEVVSHKTKPWLHWFSIGNRQLFDETPVTGYSHLIHGIIASHFGLRRQSSRRRLGNTISFPWYWFCTWTHFGPCGPYHPSTDCRPLSEEGRRLKSFHGTSYKIGCTVQ